MVEGLAAWSTLTKAVMAMTIAFKSMAGASVNMTPLLEVTIAAEMKIIISIETMMTSITIMMMTAMMIMMKTTRAVVMKTDATPKVVARLRSQIKLRLIPVSLPRRMLNASIKNQDWVSQKLLAITETKKTKVFRKF